MEKLKGSTKNSIDSCLNQLLLWWFQDGDFLTLQLFLYLLVVLLDFELYIVLFQLLP